MTGSSVPVLGVDIGGTFTDFVLIQDGYLSVHKQLTTPDDPSVGLLDGIANLALSAGADVVHGSTIATNALLERHGARTALITTEGFADVLEIGRQDRPDLYALVPRKPPPLIPAEWCWEVVERVTPEGVLIPLDENSLISVLDAIERAGIESVALCLLFSFLHPAHERRIKERLEERFGSSVSLSLSSEILPEYREYERTSTTVINAYVTPLVSRYLERVEKGLSGRRLMVMQSNGGVITAGTARKEAARTALSGPAGGAVGAFYVAQQAGIARIISFDMGGTSTDVAIFPGEMIYTREATIAGMPLRLPIIDVHTVGAGGGSIARVDAGGALRVGPESAGADPGPACYGKGDWATTSDANALLGRLHPDFFLGGRMPLNVDRARTVLARLAVDMGVGSAVEAAWGVLQVANAAMERAIRAVSVERGYDPRDFTVVPFGGAGPLHACALAEALRIPQILVPRAPGVLSALGMTVADRIKDVSQAVFAGADALVPAHLSSVFEPLGERLLREMNVEGIDAERIRLERSLDMRYRGQSHAVTVSEPVSGDWLEGFHTAHARRYGHRHDEEPVEIVAARVRAVGQTLQPEFERLRPGDISPGSARFGVEPVWFSNHEPLPADMYRRSDLLWKNEIEGPAIIFQMDTTTVVDPGWRAVVDEWGNLVLNR